MYSPALCPPAVVEKETQRSSSSRDATTESDLCPALREQECRRSTASCLDPQVGELRTAAEEGHSLLREVHAKKCILKGLVEIFRGRRDGRGNLPQGPRAPRPARWLAETIPSVEFLKLSLTLRRPSHSWAVLFLPSHLSRMGAPLRFLALLARRGEPRRSIRPNKNSSNLVSRTKLEVEEGCRGFCIGLGDSVIQAWSFDLDCAASVATCSGAASTWYVGSGSNEPPSDTAFPAIESSCGERDVLEQSIWL